MDVSPETDMRIELDREFDGRWIAEVPAIPGVIVYGNSREEAIDAAQKLAADVIADRQVRGEAWPGLDR